VKIRDGMDAAICKLSKGDKEMDVSYSGAFNSLYYVIEGELMELKANRYAIGTPIEDGPIIYEEHNIKLKEGVMMYMFSDGYPDQLGGPKGKKFMKKRFKELLVEISGKTPEQQEERLNHELITWSGDNQQVDDVLVIGIKV
jgi:serine phosphatase RsbU (regulator of sigma subunit)